MIKKAIVLNDIQLKITKNLAQVLNHCVSTASFPDLFKHADVTLVSKPGDFRGFQKNNTQHVLLRPGDKKKNADLI